MIKKLTELIRLKVGNAIIISGEEETGPEANPRSATKAKRVYAYSDKNNGRKEIMKKISTRTTYENVDFYFI